MAAVLPSTRIELPVGEFTSILHDCIFEMKFLIQSPEKSELNTDYVSEMVPVGRDGNKVGIGWRREDGDFGFFLEIQEVC
jgi:hypothetical protein